MFKRNVSELQGYVGGPVTLTNVGEIASLNKINEDTEKYAGEIAAEGYAGDGAQKMEDILNQIDALNSVGFYQGLIEDRVFFLENMCGYRPSLYSRLKAGSGYNSLAGWITTDKTTFNEDDAAGRFYAEIVSWDENGKPETYKLKNGNGVYLASTDESVVTQQATDAADALVFRLDPIIPGIWQIYHEGGKNSAETASPYLTITQNGSIYNVCHYWVSETSSLWKFKTYTTLEYALKADPSNGADEKTVAYTTFSQPVDCRMTTQNGTKAYYANDIKWNENQIRVILQELPTKEELGIEYYYMKAGNGYLFTKEGDTKALAEKVEVEYYPQYITEELDDEFKNYTNYLKPVYSDIVLDENNWKEYFALSYVPTTTTYTGYNGNPVNGIGMGFYRLKEGKTIAATKAYLKMSDFYDEDHHDASAFEDQTGVRGQMVFLDQNGEATDVVTIAADGTLYHEKDTYFDLSGREVVNPSNGIFIKNGKKIFVK